MSAFLVSHDHINAMLTVAKMHDAYVPLGCAYIGCKGADDKTLTLIGRCLLAANIVSVNARYPHMMDAKADKLIHDSFEFVEDLFFATRAGPKAKARLVSCFEYQACETDTFYQSDAYRICCRIKDAILDSLPDEAFQPWGYEKPADAPEVVSLSPLVK
jgi:hypothetical protein